MNGKACAENTKTATDTDDFYDTSKNSSVKKDRENVCA